MLPVVVHVAPQFVQVLPVVEPGIVAVIEYEPHGVVPDRVDPREHDPVLAGLQGFLPGAVPTDLRAGRMDPQVFERVLKFAVVIESDDENPGLLLEANFSGFWHQQKVGSEPFFIKGL